MRARLPRIRQAVAAGLVACATLAPPVFADGAALQSIQAAFDALVPGLLKESDVPGAVLAVGQKTPAGFERWKQAYGLLRLEPPAPMPVDAVFDLASMTKPIATATSVMILVERGRLDLDDPVGKHISEFNSADKRPVTIRHLMTHTSGLPGYLGLATRQALAEQHGFFCPRETRAAIRAGALEHPPGATFVYSCLNAILCAEIVERVSGQPLDVFAAENIFGPLGLRRTGFVRLDVQGAPVRGADASAPALVAAGGADRALTPPFIVTTRTDYGVGEGGFLRGQVHDPLAAMQRGVSGNAGLFSDVDDLSRFAELLLSGGELDGVRVLKAETIGEMTRVQNPGVTNSKGQPAPRGLLWDVHPAGAGAGHGAFGHTGYTGVAIRVYPDLGAYVLALTNRVHPDDHAKVEDFRARVWAKALESLAPGARLPNASSAQAAPTQAAPSASASRAGEPDGVGAGIDVLVRDGFKPLDGRRVGLITNQTGVDRYGRSTIELLQGAPNVRLVSLFSPEHGLHGVLDSKVADSTDPRTGLRVYSLYGETRKPTTEMLAGIDTLVFDIQDIGARFYTYIATMGLALEAAAEHGLRFVTLDRPNPITGTRVFGPLNDRDGAFTAYHRIPLVHGMTVGELARLFNEERGLHADLEVIRVEGWRRSMWFDETGLPWVHPSPNMRSLTQAALYPAIGLIEACRVSVGRGTDTPFERCGAPWIDGRRLALRLNGLGLAGVRFVPIRFTPDASKFAGQECGGVQVLLTDRDAFDPLETGLSIVRELKDLFGEDFDVDAVDRLLFERAILEQVKNSTGPTEYAPLWAEDLRKFEQRRAKHLLYE